METLLQDVRYALRMLRKSPAFTVVAILTLALGIGANTAIFSVVNAVLLRPLAYPDSGGLVFLSEWSQQVPDMSISMANFDDWRSTNTVFENLAAYQTDNVVMTGTGDPERLRVRRFTASYFPTTRVRPILGREMRPEEDNPGADRVVLLGEGFWDRRFGRDPKVLGHQVTLDGEPYTIIGVLPSRKLHGFWRRMDVFTSLWRLEDQQGGPARRDEHPGIYAIARLKPGKTVEEARREMKTIANQLAQKYPATNRGNSAEVRPLLEAYVEDVRPPLLVLLGAVGLVLLIACGNIANLLLARATERFHELAVRRALGAGPWRLVRQSLTESIVLSVTGGVVGVLMAAWVTKGLEQISYATVPRLDEASLDRTVLLFSVVLSVLTGVFFGTLPAWHASRTDVQRALREGGRGAGGSGGRLRSILVGVELGLSLVLLVGAGLMSKSLYKVMHADGGFDPTHVMTASITLPDSSYSNPDKNRAFIRQVVEKVQAVPGVEAAGFKLPLLGSNQTSVIVEGRPLPPPGQLPATDFGRVTPDAFRAMGMRLLTGRPFDERDNENAPLVCVVDDSLAKQFWPGEDPLGKRLNIDGPPRPDQPIMWRTVVGVVAHVKNYGVDQPSRVETYVPFAQRPGQGGALVVRSTLDRAGLVSALRAAVRSVDPQVPLLKTPPRGGSLYCSSLHSPGWLCCWPQSESTA
jgi:predicted permease